MDYDQFERIVNQAFQDNLEELCLENDIEVKIKKFLKISFYKNDSKSDISTREIEGFTGPYNNMYLQEYAPVKGNKTKFKKLEDAIKAANKCEYCGGITMNRQKTFTLRMGNKLKESDSKNKYKNLEISWVKIQKKPDPKTPPIINNQNKIIQKQHTNIKEIEINCEIVKYGGKEYYYYQPKRLMICKETNKQYILQRGKLSSEI